MRNGFIIYTNKKMSATYVCKNGSLKVF